MTPAWYQCATNVKFVEIIKVFMIVGRCLGEEVPMSNELLKIEPDILKDFDVLWDACGAGPDGSVRASQSLGVHLSIPHSPRRLRAEDFRDWLLP